MRFNWASLQEPEHLHINLHFDICSLTTATIQKNRNRENLVLLTHSQSGRLIFSTPNFCKRTFHKMFVDNVFYFIQYKKQMTL